MSYSMWSIQIIQITNLRQFYHHYNDYSLQLKLKISLNAFKYQRRTSIKISTDIYCSNCHLDYYDSLMRHQTVYTYPKCRNFVHLLSECLNSFISNQLISRFIIIFTDNIMFTKAILAILLIISAQAIAVLPDQQNSPTVKYPVRAVYIDKILSWWPPASIAAGLGVPGYATPHQYNYIILAFWSCSSGNLDMVNVWGNPVYYIGNDTVFGSTNGEIQQSLKKLYNDKGISIMVSAFGATEFPTTAGQDPTVCANKLADFVSNNNLDGVDIDWEDNTAMEAGTGEAWLITFTNRLRDLLPNYIISHAPQAPYFCKQYYVNGAYITIDKQVGSKIDFYNIQFYNQGSNKYDNYTTLFVTSGSPFNGTSVNQMIARGVPKNKIVIGKPVNGGDASNTGTMTMSDLRSTLNQGRQDYDWYTGSMFWQYSSDTSGSAISTIATDLINFCAANPGHCV